MKEFTLSNHVTIPAIAFGCYKLDMGRIDELIRNAWAAGYRHFDTASFYGNEEELGNAFRKVIPSRDELFLTTKLWKTQMDDPDRYLSESLKKLGTDYLDLYLIHWPRPENDKDNWRRVDKAVWKRFEHFYKEGYVRAIGVSNFVTHHLENILEDCEIVPMVDQLELHPGYMQEETVAFCKMHGILNEAWSPLGRMRVASDPLLNEIAAGRGISVPQVCLAYLLQRGILPLPKSSSPERMEANLKASEITLTEEEMKRITDMPVTGFGGNHPDFF